MPIVSMRAVKAEPHPNADRLRIYLFDADDGAGSIQIVANLENIYEVGDVVAVALAGTILEDGTKIVKGKYRGARSFGMSMGKTDKPVGTVLTAEYNATEDEKMLKRREKAKDNGVLEESVWTKYTSIDGYLKLREDILAAPEVIVTEKSHGCFASESRVMLPNGEERPFREVVMDESVTHILSRDENTGEYSPQPITVKTVTPNGGVRWVKVNLESGRFIICTEEHPFWSNDRNTWVAAKDLRPNEDLASPNE